MDTYTVKKGDTLSKIAKNLGIKLSDLIRFNKALIKNPDKIKIGWNLKLNEGPPPEKAGGPVVGKGGRGYRITYEDSGEPEFKPKVVNPESDTGRKAGAPLKEEKWRKGKEIFEEVKTPVEIAVVAPPPPPPPPPPHKRTMFEQEYGLTQDQSFGDRAKIAAKAVLTDPQKLFATSMGYWGSKLGLDEGRTARGAYDVATLGGMAGMAGGFGPRGVTAPAAPRAPTPMPGAARDYAAARAKPGGLDPNAPISSQIKPTPAQEKRLAAAIKQRERGGKQFDPGIDTNYGHPNVREPSGPVLPPGEKLSPGKPVGTREFHVVDAPEPMVVRAQDMKTWKDWRDSLRAASDNTVVLDGASDLGFVADRVMIVGGKGGAVRIDPEKVLDSFDTPILNQSQFATMLKYLGIK